MLHPAEPVMRRTVDPSATGTDLGLILGEMRAGAFFFLGLWLLTHQLGLH